MVVCFEIEENLEKKSNSLGLARCIIYVRYVNGSKIKICQLVKDINNNLARKLVEFVIFK